ncbi:hypothetical protein C0J52_27907, partial [Blattella germanica]
SGIVRFNRRVSPSDAAIRRWFTQWRVKGNVKNNSPTGRPRSVRSPENIAWVRDSVLLPKKKNSGPTRTARKPENIAADETGFVRSSQRSSMRLVQAAGILRTTPRRILRFDIANDRNVRMAFSERLFQLRMEDPAFVDKLIMSEETHFLLVVKKWFTQWRVKGNVENNSPTGRPRSVRSPENIARVRDSVLSKQNSQSWSVGYCRSGIVRFNRRVSPSDAAIRRWFTQWRVKGNVKNNSPTGRPRSVRSPENIAWVRDSVLSSPKRSVKKHAIALKISDRSLRRILHKDVQWPDRSPDLTAPDFFLWGFLKEKIFIKTWKN